MAQNVGEGVLDKVKRTFLRMASPFDIDVSRLDPLVTMNNPPMMARRDAAYDRAAKLLRDNVFSKSEAERSGLYLDILKLMDIAMENTKLILLPAKKGQKTAEQEPMLDYLRLLRDTVSAAKTLVFHELLLSSGEKQLSAFLGPQIIEQFHGADDIFSDSEMNIYHCVIELLDSAEPAVLRYREHRRRAFDKSDLDRYNKAFAEFETLYEKFGKPQ